MQEQIYNDCTHRMSSLQFSFVDDVHSCPEVTLNYISFTNLQAELSFLAVNLSFVFRNDLHLFKKNMK